MLPLLLLSQIALCIAFPNPECDLTKISIAGGKYTVTNEGKIGSTVEYSCPPGMYPYPSFSRDCLYTGHWTDEMVKAKCKPVQCPKPEMFENGDFYDPAPRYFVGDILHFTCFAGFKLIGPESRTCQANGKWSGETSKCDNQAGYCPYPGIPIGATKVGTSYNIEKIVKYECKQGLHMFGSDTRECMENKHWSGAEPSCRHTYTFDTPEEVAGTFSSSLSENIEASDPNRKEVVGDRKLTVKTGGSMNIFILIDASKSVGEANFEIAKNISEVFIEKISSFDFTPRYGVISYASIAKPIMLLSDDASNDPDAVIEKIKAFQYSAHKDKLGMGTNTRAALNETHFMLSLENTRDPVKFLETRNVFLLITDGRHNMGGDPNVEVKRIREILDIRKYNNREDFLDIYVFGLGNEIHDEEINAIASKKHNEKHVFKMGNVLDMKKAFELMLDETEVLQMCGLSKEQLEGYEGIEQVFPWIAKILTTRSGSQEKCKGTIVSKSFILTAAHCFLLGEQLHNVKVEIGNVLMEVKDISRHSNYSPSGKKGKGVEPSYDYDIALIELTTKLEFSNKIRPICIPCTTGASWALKLRGQSVTCSDHEKTLLSEELVKAMFIAEETDKALERKNVLIKREGKRLDCLKDTKQIEKFRNIADIKDAVTDNFLCTGGIEPQVDPQTCKGDSGGPVIVPYKQRFIQVGIISWGTINSCNGPKRNPEPVPAESRDFHTDVFKMLPWLREKLKEDLIFLD